MEMLNITEKIEIDISLIMHELSNMVRWTRNCNCKNICVRFSTPKPLIITGYMIFINYFFSTILKDAQLPDFTDGIPLCD